MATVDEAPPEPDEIDGDKAPGPVSGGMVREQAAAAEAGAGLRFDRFLQQLAPEESRSRLQELIRQGHATLNDRAVKPGLIVKAGDRVRLVIPPPVETEAVPQNIPLEVLFEDDQLIVIHKPPGMVVHPAAGNPDGTVVNALLHHCRDLSGIGGSLRPGIVHRLDKDTSGCLVAAKTDAAHRALAAGFAARTTRKFYLAVVQGTPGDSHGLIRNHIGRHPVDRQRMTVLRDGTGKEAVTEWHRLRSAAGASLLLCRIFTGRTHQIRVHLRENLGCPILGDPIYGPRRPAGVRDPGRLLLHAWQLGFAHPADGRPLRFRAPIPPEFEPWTADTDVAHALDVLTREPAP